MTAISALRTHATPFERVLLHGASTVDRYVATRLERRTRVAARAALYRQTAATAARSDAVARGSIGILPP